MSDEQKIRIIRGLIVDAAFHTNDITVKIMKEKLEELAKEILEVLK